MAPDLSFENLTISDLDEIMEIEHLCFPTPWSRMAFLQEIQFDKSVFEVVRLDGRLIGYGGFWHVLDEAHISNIAIHPEFQRKGYGSMLLLRLLGLAAARGATNTTLEVRRSNIAAQRLYEGFGFSIVAVRKNYYADEGEDALVMWNENLQDTVKTASEKESPHKA